MRVKLLFIFFFLFSFSNSVFPCWEGFDEKKVQESSSVPVVDELLQKELQEAKRYWNVHSKILYYHDKDTMNFWSCPDGTILLGKELVDKVVEDDPDSFSFIFFLAHELGHQVQNQHLQMAERKNVIEYELQADCLAGFYIGHTRKMQWGKFLKTIDLLDKYGMKGGTHGTKKQRYWHTKNGFNAGSYFREEKIFPSRND
ncbi:MAG: hypothetical protein KDK45_14460 [Leptospiraceae bacterium]|nr:hypothetical protein [Leptospiraceae bacterium]